MYHGTEMSIDQHRPSKERRGPVSDEWLGPIKTSERYKTYGWLSILGYWGKKSYPVAHKSNTNVKFRILYDIKFIFIEGRETCPKVQRDLCSEIGEASQAKESWKTKCLTYITLPRKCFSWGLTLVNIHLEIVWIFWREINRRLLCTWLKYKSRWETIETVLLEAFVILNEYIERIIHGARRYRISLRLFILIAHSWAQRTIEMFTLYCCAFSQGWKSLYNTVVRMIIQNSRWGHGLGRITNAKEKRTKNLWNNKLWQILTLKRKNEYCKYTKFHLTTYVMSLMEINIKKKKGKKRENIRQV